MLNVITTTRTTPNRDGDKFTVTNYTVGGYTLVHTECPALCRVSWKVYSNWGLPNIVDLSDFETETPKFGVSWSSQGTQSSSNVRAYIALLATAANVADVFTSIAASN